MIQLCDRSHSLTLLLGFSKAFLQPIKVGQKKQPFHCLFQTVSVTAQGNQFIATKFREAKSTSRNTGIREGISPTRHSRKPSVAHAAPWRRALPLRMNERHRHPRPLVSSVAGGPSNRLPDKSACAAQPTRVGARRQGFTNVLGVRRRARRRRPFTPLPRRQSIDRTLRPRRAHRC